MKIALNGHDHTLADGTTIGELLESLDTAPERVAVVVNDEIEPRAKRNAVALREGDRVELITFAGGG